MKCSQEVGEVLGRRILENLHAYSTEYADDKNCDRCSMRHGHNTAHDRVYNLLQRLESSKRTHATDPLACRSKKLGITSVGVWVKVSLSPVGSCDKQVQGWKTAGTATAGIGTSDRCACATVAQLNCAAWVTSDHETPGTAHLPTDERLCDPTRGSTAERLQFG